jgi:hypothetical protein
VVRVQASEPQSSLRGTRSHRCACQSPPGSLTKREKNRAPENGKRHDADPTDPPTAAPAEETEARGAVGPGSAGSRCDENLQQPHPGSLAGTLRFRLRLKGGANLTASM